MCHLKTIYKTNMLKMKYLNLLFLFIFIQCQNKETIQTSESIISVDPTYIC